MSRPPGHILYVFSISNCLSWVDIGIQYSLCMRMEGLAHTLARRIWARSYSAVVVETQVLGRVVPGFAGRKYQHSVSEILIKLTLYSMLFDPLLALWHCKSKGEMSED